MNNNKKGMAINAVVPAVMALFVLGIVIYVSLGPALKEPLKETFGLANGTGEEDVFAPYTVELTDEEKSVKDSLIGLAMAINGLATGKEVNRYAGRINSKDVPFDSYTISFSGHIELEENANADDDREWVFDKTVGINSGRISKQTTNFVFADYYYGSCDNDNEDDGWVKCKGYGAKTSDSSGDCFCEDEDDYSRGDMKGNLVSGDEPTYKNRAKSAGLAPVRDIMPVYNLGLTVSYKNGTECFVSTSGSKHLTPRKKSEFGTGTLDLLVWGSKDTSVTSCKGNSNWNVGDGCDRDGDGIQGEYGSKFIGDRWEDAVRYTNDATSAENKIQMIKSSGKDKLYFPDGTIRRSSDGEGCLDSPTWLECPGLRIYYCGKGGYNFKAGSQTKNHYFKIHEGSVHSRAGIKYLSQIAPGTFNHSQSSNNRKDGKQEITIRDETSDDWSTWAEGAWSYAREYDLDVILGGVIALETKQLNDPKVFCAGGKVINNGTTVVECSPGEGCAVCGFEFPQNISRDYDTAMAWFAGYGDPKYLVYYESFPPEEEDPWIISPLSVAWGTIALTNLASHALPVGGTVLKLAGKFTSKIFFKAGRKLPFLSKIVKGVKFTAMLPITMIKGAAKRVGNLIRAGVTRGVIKLSPEYYLRFATKSDDVLRVLLKNPKQSLKLGVYLDDVVESMYKGGIDPSQLVRGGTHAIADNFDDLLKLSRKELFDKLKNVAPGIADDVLESTDNLIVSRYVLKSDPALATTFEQMAEKLKRNNLMKVGVKTSAKYGLAYSAALTLAWEDSRNQKFVPLGANKIGWKKPYNWVFATGETLPTGEKIPELDDKVNKYTILLEKDQFKGGAITNVAKNQNKQRFFLASPCKADLAVVKADIQCYPFDGEEIETINNTGVITTYEVSHDIPEANSLAREKYGYIPFLDHTTNKEYNKSDPRRYEDGVKECIDKSSGWSSITWESPLLTAKAIIVNPVPVDGYWKEGNFCYGGSNLLADVAKIGIMVGTIGMAVLTEIAATAAQTAATVSCPFTFGGGCVAIPAIEVIQGGVDIAIEGGMAALMNEVEKTEKWPRH